MRRLALALLLASLVGCDGGDTHPTVVQPTETSYEGKTLTAWLAALDSPSERPSALRALRSMRPEDPRVVPAIANCLGDSSAATRELAGAALATIGDAGLHAAAAKLRDGSAQEQLGAAAALAAAGSRGIPDLVSALASPTESARTAAATALKGMGGTATEALKTASDSGGKAQRITALLALSELEGDDALVAALGDSVLEETARRALDERGEAARPALERGARGLGAGPKARELLAKLDTARAHALVGRLAAPGSSAVDEAVALGPAAVDALVPLLGSPDETTRQNAVSALTQIGYAAESPANERLLSIQESERRAAADVLLGIGSESSLHMLGLALGSDNPATRETAAAVLVETPDVGNNVLVVALLGGQPRAQTAAAAAMARLGTQGINSLADAARVAPTDVRAIAVTALDNAGNPGTPALIVALSNDDDGTATQIEAALVKRGASVVPLLLLKSADAEWSARERGISVLTQIGSAGLDPLLAAALVGSAAERELARRLLAPLGPAAVRKLVPQTRDSSAAVRAAAANALLAFVPAVPEAAVALTDLVGDEDASVRYAAVRGLGGLDEFSLEQQKLLAGRLRDDDGRVRVAAAAAMLGSNEKDRRARAALAAAWNSDDPIVRSAALMESYTLAADDDRADVIARGLTPEQPKAVRMVALELLETLPIAPEWARPIQLAAADEDPTIRARGTKLYDVLTKDPWLELTSGDDAIVGRQRGWKDAPRRFGTVRCESVELALEWLKNHQSADGRWEADGFERQCKLNRCGGQGHSAFDPGITGLALLCFLANGNTATKGPHAQTVKKGLEYLISIQDSEGCFGPRTAQSYQYNHAFASLAMVEAYLLTGVRAVEEPAQRAVNFVHASQNPYLAWRYGVRDGDNDTSVTGCMVAVLRAATLAELDVDRGSLRGAVGWIDKMTEPEFGRVGYQQRGGRGQRYKDRHDRFPVDQVEPLTAIGISVRAAAGGDPGKDEFIQKGAQLLLNKRPRWDLDAGTNDFYYWFWGSVAMNEVGGRSGDLWDKALVEELPPNQRTETGRDERGAWDPVGPWAPALGRVGSTALACLALQSPWRYPNTSRRR